MLSRHCKNGPIYHAVSVNDGIELLVETTRKVQSQGKYNSFSLIGKKKFKTRKRRVSMLGRFYFDR